MFGLPKVVLALALSAASGFTAPRATPARPTTARNVLPVDANIFLAARELYEIGGVQMTADVQQFPAVGGLVAFMVGANLVYMSLPDGAVETSMGGSAEMPEPAAEEQAAEAAEAAE
mmetsp:Transcript_8934/g.26810  ORF Transcript_8934/g.26810 Transcript_8934/m.26810 type:complete len:117 (+) Transcript_8934:144-494(+)